MKQYRTKRIAIFAFLAVCVTAFIFWNSTRDAQASRQLSNGVLSFLKPLLLPLFGDSEELMQQVIRKGAHFVEFAALGGCMYGLASGIRSRFWRHALLFFPLFMMLSVAVTDEFIQSFSAERSSVVKDVILDFGGGVFGLGAASVLSKLLHRRKKK